MNTTNYPKVQAKLDSFISNLMSIWMVMAGDEGMEENELSAEYIRQSATTLIGSNPRLLYDFLDENHVYLQPILASALEPEKGWLYELSTPIGVTDGPDTPFLTRKDAEQAGYDHAFKLLEELL